ncbi:MAG TPA: 16S rRNA (cytidine(1402)-2'-O)-methyltransferase, partial [Albitalea sp.]
LAQGFCFVGFLPARSAERAAALKALVAAPTAQVLFEAPHRIEALAQGLAAACPDRRTTLCRELTKQFETVATMPAAALPDWLAADANRLRGEFVLVLHALAPSAAADAPSAHDALLKPLLAALPLKQAVALAAEQSGAPRNALYARALELKRDASS